MTTGEIVLSAFVSLIVGLGGIFWGAAIARGKQSAAMKFVMDTLNSHTNDLKFHDTEIEGLRAIQIRQEGMMDTLIKDHSNTQGSILELKDTLLRTNEELNGIGRSNAVVAESVDGLKDLLQNIIRGDLIIKPRA